MHASYVLSSLVRGDDATLPWLLPGVAISAVVAVLAGGAVARALGAHRAVATLLVFSLGVIVSATLTPVGGDLVFDGASPGACDLTRVGLPALGLFRSLNDASLNVLLFLPLGVAIALLPRTRRSAVVLVGAVLLPFAIEATQLLVPAISRGCESADVVDNLLGLAVGLAIGGVSAWLWRRLDRSTAS
jgi:hypothetical protein